MISVFEVYQSASDKINPSENGDFSFSRFNRLSWLAQLRLIDWLSGDVSGIQPPQPYLTQKNKDWLSFLIVPYTVQIVEGFMDKPKDYYQWDNAYLLGDFNNSDCEDEVEKIGKNTPIQLLNGDQFYQRMDTDVDGLAPSFKAPIAKMVGSRIELRPLDLGSMTLEYIRYPVKSFLATKVDEVFNDEVYDREKSEDFEWPEFAHEILAWFIAEAFSEFTREQALYQHNSAIGKTVRK